MSMKPKTTVSGQLRAAIKDSGMSPYRICKSSGIDQAALSRFLNGRLGLTLATVDKLADVLGLELAPKKGQQRCSDGAGHHGG